MKNLMPKPHKQGRFTTRRITLLAFWVAIALVVSLIESMLPPLIPLAPGAKLGLSNIAPLLALIILGIPDAFTVLIIKCLLGAVISGGVSGLMYSVPSGIVSLAIEIVLFYLIFDRMSLAGISLVGAVVFNTVQLIVACFVTGVNLVMLLPYLVAAGMLAGAFTGLLTYNIVKRLPYSVYGAYR